MIIVEFSAVVEKDGVVQIPREEMQAMGIKEGDEIYFSYIMPSQEDRMENTKEFMKEKIK